MREIHAWPRLMRQPEAAAYCGGETNLKSLCSDFGLRPVIRRKGNTTYDIQQIDAAINRAIAAGWETLSTRTEK